MLESTIIVGIGGNATKITFLKYLSEKSANNA